VRQETPLVEGLNVADGAEEKDEVARSSLPVFESFAEALADALVRLARAIELQELRLGGDERTYHAHRRRLRSPSPYPGEDLDREVVRRMEAKYSILRELYPPDDGKD
jgi:predicted NBD/HSP70 family sugar kinase